MESALSKSSYNAIGSMFDRIAPAYDKLNHILSFGMDFYWRSTLAGLVDKEKELHLFDIATGTGDLLIALLKKNPNIVEAEGLDISAKMLAICQKKISRLNLAGKVKLICSDVNAYTLSDNKFDIVTMGFGIRNTRNVPETLAGIFRHLKNGGTTLILEFAMPSNIIIRFIYLRYLRHIVPFIGRIISGDNHAYRYLNDSIEKFCNIDEFTLLMKQTGFVNVEAMPLTCGIVCIYKGSKPLDSVL